MNSITNNNNIFISELSALNFVEIDKPVLTYDTLSKQVVFTFIGRNSQSMEHVVEMRIKVTDVYNIERIYVYTPQDILSTPTVYMPISITAIAGEEFSLPVAADGVPATLGSSLTANTSDIGKYKSFISSVAYLDTLNAINNNNNN